MSLDTWKKEFYPKTAGRVKLMSDAVDHSLLKWRGLFPRNLKRHRVFWGYKTHTVSGCSDERLVYQGKRLWAISPTTCALCRCCGWGSSGNNWNQLDCGLCPLCQVRSGCPCCKPMPKEVLDPYHHFERTGDPKLMVQWLRKAKKYQARLTANG